MEFQHAISLGAWCQVDYQLRRHFRKRTMSVFESFVTPWPGLLGVLRDGTVDLGQTIKDNRWAESAECVKYGILLPHEFPRTAKEEVIVSLTAHTNMSQKFNHKHQKMLNTLSRCEGDVLFVRYGGHALPAYPWPYREEPDPFDLQQVDQLCFQLTRLFPALSFRLLFVYEAETTKVLNEGATLDRRVSVVPINRQNDYSRWEGNDRLWDTIFDDEKRKIVVYQRAISKTLPKAPQMPAKPPELKVARSRWRLPTFFKSEK